MTLCLRAPYRAVMNSKLSPVAVGASVGIASAVLFWVGFVAILFAFPDPQNGIGLVMSPCLALWFGGSVGAIVFASKVLSTPDAVAAIAPMIIGIVALGVLLLFLGGELFQMMHPTPAVR
ncbi:MAG TPA: hypothetical protein VFG20_19500 [Planctomycetaceae bacterium]|nr:hypothetical protein [Planctomycetaceae bacterium]